MTTFEYELSRELPYLNERLENKLDRYREDGWEIICLLPIEVETSKGKITCFKALMKREKKEKAKEYEPQIA